MADTVKVTSRNMFQDSETGRAVVPGDVFEVSKVHAEDLESLGLVEIGGEPTSVAKAPAKPKRAD
jgi:hypothetical protein